MHQRGAVLMARQRQRSRTTYFFEVFNGFADWGVQQLSRSEMAAYIILLRDTKPDGTARTGFTDLARRGGMSRASAIRAVKSLINRGVVEVVKRGGRGIGASTYCCIPGGIEIFRRERQAGSDGDT